MTKSEAQIFTELTGVCWHGWEAITEWVESIPTGTFFKCQKCGAILDCKENENPTYSAVDILKRMKEFCGEEKYRKFIRTKAIGLCQLTDDEWIISIYETYILNPALLLKKCNEFISGTEK